MWVYIISNARHSCVCVVYMWFVHVLISRSARDCVAIEIVRFMFSRSFWNFRSPYSLCDIWSSSNYNTTSNRKPLEVQYITSQDMHIHSRLKQISVWYRSMQIHKASCLLILLFYGIVSLHFYVSSPSHYNIIDTIIIKKKSLN